MRSGSLIQLPNVHLLQSAVPFQERKADNFNWTDEDALTVNCEVQVPSNSYPTFKFPPKDVVSQPGRKIFSCFLSTLWKQFTDSCLIEVHNHIANHNLSHSVVNLRYQKNFHCMHQEKKKILWATWNQLHHKTHSQLAQQSFIADRYVRHSLYVILLVEKTKIQLKSKTK
ncbi:hypothetical protein ACB092_03G222300 [Castanea dentata]